MDNQQQGSGARNADEKVFGKGKDVDQLDPFFVEASKTDDQNDEEVEKRAVMRDGRVPKFKKNLEKMQQRAMLAQQKREGWLQVKEEKREKKEKE